VVSQTIRVAGSDQGLIRASAALDAFTLAQGLPPPVSQALHVALDEMFSNAVRHGYAAAGRAGEIELRFGLADGAVELLMLDEAPPFDPLVVREPDTEAGLEERQVGGLGIFLVRRLMDAVEYERSEGKNRLRLVKRLPG
jgi:serine/threonine-protein kinase RsbW